MELDFLTIETTHDKERKCIIFKIHVDEHFMPLEPGKIFFNLQNTYIRGGNLFPGIWKIDVEYHNSSECNSDKENIICNFVDGHWLGEFYYNEESSNNEEGLTLLTDMIKANIYDYYIQGNTHPKKKT